MPRGGRVFGTESENVMLKLYTFERIERATVEAESEEQARTELKVWWGVHWDEYALVDVTDA